MHQWNQQKKWLVFIAAVNSFLSSVDEHFKAIIEKDTIKAKKNKYYSRLLTEIHKIGEMSGPLTGLEMLKITESTGR